MFAFIIGTVKDWRWRNPFGTCIAYRSSVVLDLYCYGGIEPVLTLCLHPIHFTRGLQLLSAADLNSKKSSVSINLFLNCFYAMLSTLFPKPL